MDKINLDCAATTKIDENALKAMEGIMLNYFYNPSSHHCGGYEALAILKKARADVAKAVGAQESQIRFTSGGSEGDNWALNTFKHEGIIQNRKHIIISAMEHHAITRCCESFKEIGFEITVVKPNKLGIITPEELEKHIKDTTIGVSVMAVNNEIGVIQDVEALGAVCHKHNVILAVDEAHGALWNFSDKMPKSALELGADVVVHSILLVGAARKIETGTRSTWCARRSTASAEESMSRGRPSRNGRSGR